MSSMHAFPTLAVDHILDNQKILGAIHRVYSDDFPSLLSDADINQQISKAVPNNGMMDTRFIHRVSH